MTTKKPTVNSLPGSGLSYFFNQSTLKHLKVPRQVRDLYNDGNYPDNHIPINIFSNNQIEKNDKSEPDKISYKMINNT